MSGPPTLSLQCKARKFKTTCGARCPTRRHGISGKDCTTHTRRSKLHDEVGNSGKGNPRQCKRQRGRGAGRSVVGQSVGEDQRGIDHQVLVQGPFFGQPFFGARNASRCQARKQRQPPRLLDIHKEAGDRRAGVSHSPPGLFLSLARCAVLAVVLWAAAGRRRTRLAQGSELPHPLPCPYVRVRNAEVNFSKFWSTSGAVSSTSCAAQPCCVQQEGA